MNNLRKLREAKKLSLRELGKELDMNASVLGNYERGDRNPKTEVWEKIARYFDVSVPYIMGLSDDFENTTKKIAEELEEQIKLSSNMFDNINIDELDENTKQTLDDLKTMSDDLEELFLNLDPKFISPLIQAHIQNFFTISNLAEMEKLSISNSYLELTSGINDLITSSFFIDFTRYGKDLSLRKENMKKEFGTNKIKMQDIENYNKENPIDFYYNKENITLKRYLELKEKINESLDLIFYNNFSNVYDNQKDDSFYKAGRIKM